MWKGKVSNSGLWAKCAACQEMRGTITRGVLRGLKNTLLSYENYRTVTLQQQTAACVGRALLIMVAESGNNSSLSPTSERAFRLHVARYGIAQLGKCSNVLSLRPISGGIRLQYGQARNCVSILQRVQTGS